VLETLKEVALKEKYPEFSFLSLLVCKSHHVWLILPFGIESNLFKLLCIEVISKHDILFWIDDWYYFFVCNAWFTMISKFEFDQEVLLSF